ncbi:galactokinase [Cellulomonas massiliensis]|uniref:galactokinase n=1 Tax=Cellulomonas massiliensis TaxID=1465811 RepID=UPI00030EA9BD|nr:galactokinase [Cellulomonas massiliensis]
MSGPAPAWERGEGAARAAAAYREAFGVAPQGVWSAPGRVNLIGEHTDYNGGLCLPVALPHRTYVALTVTDDRSLALASRQESAPWRGRLDDVTPGMGGWPSYAAGVAWALEQDGARLPGFTAAVDSCVPYGAGLSSSAALECAVAVALDDVAGLGLASTEEGRAALAAACVRAENEVAGAATGGMDQAASLLGAAGHALLLDTRDGSRRQLPFDLAAHGLALLVVDTRAEHRLADGQYGRRRATCEAAASALGVSTLREVVDLDAALARLTADVTLPSGEVVGVDVVRRRVRHVVTEIARVQEFVALLEAGGVRDVGPVMDASHASLRDDYEVSCEELDVVVTSARAAGALGARMTGGGFGGSAIALVEADAVDHVARAVSEAFAARGLREPGMLLAEPAAAAGRDEAP